MDYKKCCKCEKPAVIIDDDKQYYCGNHYCKKHNIQDKYKLEKWRD